MRTWQANESTAYTNTCDQGQRGCAQVEQGDDDDDAARGEDVKDEQENTSNIRDDDYHPNILPMIPTDLPMQLT